MPDEPPALEFSTSPATVSSVPALSTSENVTLAVDLRVSHGISAIE